MLGSLPARYDHFTKPQLMMTREKALNNPVAYALLGHNGSHVHAIGFQPNDEDGGQSVIPSVANESIITKE